MRGVVSIADQQPLMAYLAKAVALGEEDAISRVSAAETLGLPDRVIKALQAPMVTSDSDMSGLTDSLAILTSFVPMLRSTSVFFALLDKMVRLPLRTRATWLTGAGSYGVANEGQAIKVSRLATDKMYMDTLRSTGIICFSKELLQWLSRTGEAFLSMELRRAISASVDAGFLGIITDDNTPTRASVGSSAGAAINDLKFLLDSTQLKANSKPLFVLAPDTARRAATMYSGVGGGLLFPTMGPMGGTLLNVPAIVCDAMTDGSIGLIDGAGIAGDAEGIEMKSARHATLQLESAPDSPVTGSTQLINLWAHNLVGLMPQVYFGAERLRTNAFATVTAVAWGSGDSP